MRRREEGGRAAAYFVLEVCVILQDRTLVGARPHVVLHHVLLLGQVAIKLEQRHDNGTRHAAAQMAKALAGPPQRRARPPWAQTSRGRLNPLCWPGPHRQLLAAPREGTGSQRQPQEGTLPPSLWLKDTARCHLDLEATRKTQDLTQAGFWDQGPPAHLRGSKEAEIKQNPRTQSARQVRCCRVSL